jgi:CTP:molybdopterin cytidylyltransferase MocA
MSPRPAPNPADENPSSRRDVVVTVVLAAGSGQRMGGPKALLAWPSRQPGQPELPLAIAHAEARLAAESRLVMVVTRPAVVRSLLMHVRPGVDLLASTAADELGPAGSLAFAASRLSEARAVVITPVDTPPARAETVQALLARLLADPATLAVRPRYDRRAGHPVVVRPAALEVYRDASAPPPLRDHLRSLGPACVDLDIEDSAVLVDLDTAAQVGAWLRAVPRFLR